MLARKWSLESCREACSPSRMCSRARRRQDRRDDGFADVATLFRCRTARSDPEKVRIAVAEMISNSSARDWVKCSHSDFDCSTPSASSSCLSSGTQDPHDVPALVQLFKAGTSAQPPAIASVRSPLVTLLQEQICAAAGSAPTPSCAPPDRDPTGRDDGQRVAGQLARRPSAAARRRPRRRRPGCRRAASWRRRTAPAWRRSA